jgi:uncharacterized protein YqgC (DUF456 family)
VDALTILALILVFLAVLGSFVPVLPGGLLSVAGVLVYWHGQGFSSPGTLFLAGFVLTGLFAAAFDWFGGSLAAKAGGASTKTSAMAGIGSLLGFLVAGPIGVLLGSAGVVLARELLRTGDTRESSRAAVYATAGVLSTAVVQFVVTLSLLFAFVTALIL